MKGLPIVLAASTILVLAGSVPWSAGQSSHGFYHDDGPAPLLEGRDVFLAHGGVPDLSSQDAYLVIAPQTLFSQSETQALRAFLDRGGAVLIAGSTGPAARLLESLDAGIHNTRTPITSPVAEGGVPLFFATDALPGLPSQIALRHASALTGDGVPVLQSSPLAWLDLDADGRPDLGEPQGTWNVAVIAPVGAGAVLAVTDVALLEHPAILDWTGDRRVVVDEGHRPQADPVGIAPLLAGHGTAPLAVGLALAAAFLAAWAVRLRLTRPRRPRPVRSDDALTRQVLEELP